MKKTKQTAPENVYTVFSTPSRYQTISPLETFGKPRSTSGGPPARNPPTTSAGR